MHGRDGSMTKRMLRILCLAACCMGAMIPSIWCYCGVYFGQQWLISIGGMSVGVIRLESGDQDYLPGRTFAFGRRVGGGIVWLPWFDLTKPYVSVPLWPLPVIPVIVRYSLERYRRRKGCCASCGYPIDPCWAKCPECGNPNIRGYP